MKKIALLTIILLVLAGCFTPPDVSVPYFVPKTSPDSLIERGIDAHYENAIYLEWEEPETVEDEGIMGYYIYRGKKVDQEYQFKYLDKIERNTILIYDTDKYTDRTANLDTMYYYYIKSYNNFTTSINTSDTVQYMLVEKPSIYRPSGNITSSKPEFYFTYPSRVTTRVAYFYVRLYYNEDSSYKVKFFAKKKLYNFSTSGFSIYLNGNDDQTTILIDELWENGAGENYLQPGEYRWRVDAVSGELGGMPETVGSETDWMSFTVQ